jgi:hypothetical protein
VYIPGFDLPGGHDERNALSLCPRAVARVAPYARQELVYPPLQPLFIGVDHNDETKVFLVPLAAQCVDFRAQAPENAGRVTAGHEPHCPQAQALDWPNHKRPVRIILKEDNDADFMLRHASL